MDNVSSSIQDQLSYNKKIESQLAQLAAALPFATNPKEVNTITTRGGKSTHDSPYPTRTVLVYLTHTNKSTSARIPL